MENAPEIPNALEVRLYDLSLVEANTFRLWLELGPERHVALDFPADSEASERLLECLTELATQAFSELGRRGVVINEFTLPVREEDDSEERDE